jgi:hypothetical protein
MIKFLYTDDVEIDPNEVMELLYLGKKYDIPGLVEKCCLFLEQGLAVSNAVEIYGQAKLFSDEDLMEKCLQLIDNDGHTFINTNEFLKDLDRETFRTILARDTLCAREIDVFDALFWWAEQQLPPKPTQATLREFVGDLFFLVRFPRMTMKEIVQIVYPRGLLTPAEFIEALKHTMKREDTKKTGVHLPTEMFPNARRSLGKEVIIKMSSLKNGALLGATPRFERVVDKGHREIRFVVNCRLFMTKIKITNVPHRLTQEGYVLRVKVIDVLIKEVVDSIEYKFTRDPQVPPTPATYVLELPWIELCPRLQYDLVLSLDGPATPEIKTIITDESVCGRAFKTMFHYFGRVFNDDIIVEELHMST